MANASPGVGTVHFTTPDPDPGVVLPADYTFQPSDQGVAAFPGGVILITAGMQTVTVTDTAQNITGQAGVTVRTPRGHHRWPRQLTQAVDFAFLPEKHRREPWLAWGDLAR